MTKKCNYSFSAEKNYKLISERKVSFEEIISVIESNCLLDIIEHPNPNKYSEQKMYIVKFNEYAYLECLLLLKLMEQFFERLLFHVAKLLRNI